MLQAVMIPLNEIYADHQFNCRGRVAPIDVMDLVQSIEKVGLQQPIVLQPWDKIAGKKYRVIAGHRRFVAYKVLKKDEIPAFIQEISDVDAYKINLMENIARKDLNLMQEAMGIKHLFDAGLNQEEVAFQLHQTRGWVQIRAICLSLPKQIQEVVAAGMLSQAEIREIHGLPEAKQFEAVRIIKEKKEKGLKVDLNFKQRKIKPFQKRERKRYEIFALQEQIREAFGPNILTRLLGWCAGEVSNFEIHRDLRDQARKENKVYEIPKEMIEL